MDIKKISELIELLKDSSVAELEIREGETSIRISQQHASAAPIIMQAPMMQQQPMMAAAPNAATPSSIPATAAAAPPCEITGHTVRSPMVGTVYLSPNPTAKSFVEIGQSVKPGDVLCIVEAMKMMNQIEADTAGVVKARLIENASPVEFDQPLFVIE